MMPAQHQLCRHGRVLQNAVDEIAEEVPSFLSFGRGRRTSGQLLAATGALNRHIDGCRECLYLQGRSG